MSLNFGKLIDELEFSQAHQSRSVHIPARSQRPGKSAPIILKAMEYTTRSPSPGPGQAMDMSPQPCLSPCYPEEGFLPISPGPYPSPSPGAAREAPICVRVAVLPGVTTWPETYSEEAWRLVDTAEFETVAKAEIKDGGHLTTVSLVDVYMRASSKTAVKKATMVVLQNNEVWPVVSETAKTAMAEVDCGSSLSVAEEDIYEPEECIPGVTYMLTGQSQEGRLRGRWITPRGRFEGLVRGDRDLDDCFSEREWRYPSPPPSPRPRSRSRSRSPRR